MSRRAELIALLVSDTIALSLAYVLFYAARFKWGWLAPPVTEPPYLFAPMLLVTLFWLVLFLFFGMYRERFAASRFDEFVALIKVVTLGILILFFVLFIDTLDPGHARSTLFFYWLSVIGLVSGGRMIVRSIQKALILRGKGTHRALIVGWSDQVQQLYEEVARYPEAGLDIVGLVRLRRRKPATPVAAGSEAAWEVEEEQEYTIEDLPRLIDDLHIQDVLIALGPGESGYIMEVLRACEGKPVALKLVPDFYHIISGMARTEHLYGLPLIEVLPEPMPPWEQTTKRILDVTVSFLVLALGAPLWALIALLIKVTSPGPIIYRQQRVGQHGKVFTMYKFRTMRPDAEQQTGPVWARPDDPRYTPFGRWLRKTRLDEVPQLWNVLKGEMSLVGPRPERPYFVSRLMEEIPLYARRHRVKPGITGLAQVKWRYDTSIEDVRQKVKYDLFYIANMSLRMDFKILFQTIRTALSAKGH